MLYSAYYMYVSVRERGCNGGLTPQLRTTPALVTENFVLWGHCAHLHFGSYNGLVIQHTIHLLYKIQMTKRSYK